MPVLKRAPVPALFVVGMPRSGTTLLRNLMNQHSAISLTRYESHFVPLLLKTLEGATDPHGIESRREIERIFFGSTIYIDGVRRDGLTLDAEHVRSGIAQAESTQELVRFLLSHYATDKPQLAYWGDKTPGYLKHLDILDRNFDGARFLHIIRDPRDRAISESQAWGKSPLRSAQHWNERILSAREAARSAGAEYMEVRYEDVVLDTKAALTGICDWLGLDYEASMSSPIVQSDELGQSRGITEVSTTAVAGQRHLLNDATLSRIEAIAAPLATELGYTDAVEQHRLPASAQAILAMRDRLRLVRYYLRTRGLRNGIVAARAAARERA